MRDLIFTTDTVIIVQQELNCNLITIQNDINKYKSELTSENHLSS